MFSPEIFIKPKIIKVEKLNQRPRDWRCAAINMTAALLWLLQDPRSHSIKGEVALVLGREHTCEAVGDEDGFRDLAVPGSDTVDGD